MVSLEIWRGEELLPNASEIAHIFRKPWGSCRSCSAVSVAVEKEFSMTSSYSIEKSAPGLSGIESRLGGAPCYPALSLLGSSCLSHISKVRSRRQLPRATSRITFSKTENMSEWFRFIRTNTHIEELI